MTMDPNDHYWALSGRLIVVGTMLCTGSALLWACWPIIGLVLGALR